MQLGGRETSLTIECLLVLIDLWKECHFLSQFVGKGMPCGRSQSLSWLCLVTTPPVPPERSRERKRESILVFRTHACMQQSAGADPGFQGF